MKSFIHHSYLQFVKQLKTRFTPFIQSIPYKGLNVFYSRGTSIMTPFLSGESMGATTYEPEISSRLVAELKRTDKKGGFIDVGANIGLTSINVLSEIRDLKIYAFEPGPHQYALLKKTIRENQIANITLSDYALSDKEGFADFVIHATEHASGDGFIDTGRAGKGTVIQVQTTTLDLWWKKNGSPAISAIKIDAEGSEFWILQGAKMLIEQEQPFILMEFYPAHFARYPFSETDVIRWFHERAYRIYTVETNQELRLDNLESMKADLRDIVALPEKLSDRSHAGSGT